MTSIAARLRAQAQAVYDKAVIELTRKANGMFDEAEVLAAVERLRRPEFDVDAARRKDAKAIIDILTKPEADEEDEPESAQLVLFNDSYSFAPKRLIRCGGDIVENVRAPLEAKEADLDRARINRQRAQVWEDRKSIEVTHFRRWRDSERDKGRPVLDLTWGNCARETGILRDS